MRKWSLPVVALLLAACGGCRRENPAGPDAQGAAPAATTPEVVTTPPVEPASADGGDGTENAAAVEPAEAAPEAPPEEDAAVAAAGEKLLLRATGRAKRGRDMSLARDEAAERARAQLMKTMKEKGYLNASSDRLEGATIERFYVRGRYVYAVAAIGLEAGVNDPAAPASKSSEERGRNQPHGGNR